MPRNLAAYTVEVFIVPIYSILFTRTSATGILSITAAAPTWPSMLLPSIYTCSVCVSVVSCRLMASLAELSMYITGSVHYSGTIYC
jgi:hypothetical protein